MYIITIANNSHYFTEVKTVVIDYIRGTEKFRITFYLKYFPHDRTQETVNTVCRRSINALGTFMPFRQM